MRTKHWMVPQRTRRILTRYGTNWASVTEGATYRQWFYATEEPPHLTLRVKDQRTSILNNASQLKSAGDNFSRIYIKRDDVHLSIRKEWKRLRDMEAAENARPENVGCITRLDTKERKLYKDDVVIDSWNAQFFSR